MAQTKGHKWEFRARFRRNTFGWKSQPAVNRAIEALVPIIAGAPVDAETREGWLERLWRAYQDDAMPYMELLGDH
jgi:hypothetical protein